MVRRGYFEVVVTTQIPVPALQKTASSVCWIVKMTTITKNGMHLGAGTNATTNTMHSIAHDAIITLSHTHTQTDAHMLMELYDHVYALAV